MKIMALTFSILLIFMFLSSCYYDNLEYLYPGVNAQCDTTNVTYSLSVKPILENNCFSCHSNNTSALGGNIKLENYADLRIQVDNGHLLGAINHNNGFSPMPSGAPKLEDCKINVFNIWIQAGSPEN